jgi:cell pole-organizing protein PopZ
VSAVPTPVGDAHGDRRAPTKEAEMTQAAKAQEPSMEEILASIRRIIADDDAAKTPAKAAEPKPPAPQPAARPAAPAAPAPSAANSQDDIDAMFGSLDAPDTAPAAEPAQPDILDLTEAMEASAAQAAGFRTINAQADVDFNETPQAPPVANTVAEARRQFQQSMPERSLLAPSTTAAVDSAFNTLAQTVLVKNARTLDEMVAEMLRPMLKAWLDDNLPGMVERIVRDEIERVSRGRVKP